ncbi:MAG: hypothetical protein AAF699_10245 [Pseudomonadota bacterium]
MPKHPISVFMQYFQAFECVIAGTQTWSSLNQYFASDAIYEVKGVPFACRIVSPEAIVPAMQKSVAGFDSKMHSRLLEVTSIHRIKANQLRVDLISGYGLGPNNVALAPVSMHVTTSAEQIQTLTDDYDMALVGPVLTRISAIVPEADPTYI